LFARIRSGMTFGNVIAVIALFVALGGTGYAAIKLPKNSVGAKQIRKNAVRSAKVKNRTLRRADFRGRKLPRGARGPRGFRGLRGFTGARGAQGGFKDVTAQFTRTLASDALPSGQTRDYTVFCPAGSQGVGGGVRGDEFDSEATSVSASHPVTSASNPVAAANGARFTGWRATVTNVTGAPGIRPEVWVFCVPAP
jgi:hypothetical protein